MYACRVFSNMVTSRFVHSNLLIHLKCHAMAFTLPVHKVSMAALHSDKHALEESTVCYSCMIVVASLLHDCCCMMIFV